MTGRLARAARDGLIVAAVVVALGALAAALGAPITWPDLAATAVLTGVCFVVPFHAPYPWPSWWCIGWVVLEVGVAIMHAAKGEPWALNAAFAVLLAVCAWASMWLHYREWQPDPDRPLGRHRGGKPWHKTRIPRRGHTCKPWTRGLHQSTTSSAGFTFGTFSDVIERCRCGARRTDTFGTWTGRNTRTKKGARRG